MVYVAITLAVLLCIWGLHSAAAAYLRSELSERLSPYNHTFNTQSISLWSLGTVVLSDVVVEHGLAKTFVADELRVSYSLWPFGKIKDIKASRGELILRRTESGEDNFSVFFKKNSSQEGTSTASSTGLRSAALSIEKLSFLLELEDERAVTRVQIKDVNASLPSQGKGSISLSNLSLRTAEQNAITIGHVKASFLREEQDISLRELFFQKPSVTIRRAPWLGLPVAPLLSLARELRGKQPRRITTADKNTQRALALTPVIRVEDANLVFEEQLEEGVARIGLQNIQASTIQLKGQDQEKTRAAISFRISGGAKDEETNWKIGGAFDPSKLALRLRIEAENVRLKELSPYIEGASFVDSEEATVNAFLDLHYEHDAFVETDGKLALHKVTIDHPKLAETPVQNLSLDFAGKARYDIADKKLTIENVSLKKDSAEVKLDGEIHRQTDKTTYLLTASMPETPCNNLFSSIPQELLPALEGFTLDGTFSFNLKLQLDTSKLKDLRLDGSLDLNSCRVKEAGDKTKVSLTEFSEGSFEHVVEEPDGKTYRFWVGGGSENWVSLDEISVYMVNGIITTEDGSFFTHKGTSSMQVIRSMVANLAAGSFRRGASTITMQLVKNVFLNRKKTISRKLQELVLTWWVEQNVSKERILSLYFNLIEFGPGIYGLKKASEHYFECLPSELTPWQAAYLLSIIPNPKKFYSMYEKKKVSPNWTERVRRILDAMYKKERLTEEEYQEARQAEIVFGRSAPSVEN